MDAPGSGLAGKRVLVTGATGFVGGALAQRLKDLGAEVTGAGRRLDKAEWLGIDMVRLDLADRLTYPEALAGQEILFHVAAWTGRGGEEDARKANIEAPAAIVRAAAEAGVQRVVFVSTVGAYGLPDRDTITEDTPLQLTQPDVYERTKAMGEGPAIEAAREAGIELVVVRPGMVYGPRSAAWTIGMAKLVGSGTPVLLGKADGNAFPVYIDNLVDGLLLAATMPQAAGETFHLVDAPVTWRRWFGYFADMHGKKARGLPGALAKVLALAAEKLPLGLPLSRRRLAFLGRPLVFDTSKARRVLGWEPAVGIDEGMKRSEAWLREQGRI